MRAREEEKGEGWKRYPNKIDKEGTESMVE